MHKFISFFNYFVKYYINKMEPSNKSIMDTSILTKLLNAKPTLSPDINYHKISIAPMLVNFSFRFKIICN